MAIDPQLKVLLVEDSEIMRKMEVKILAALGITNVAEAGDGQEAVAILQGPDPVDLIISDWNMPNMDGYQLLQWVRASGNRQTVPFLMATAQGELDVVNKAKEAGVSGLVSKPFSSGELGQAIDNALTSLGLDLDDEGPAVRQPVVGPDGKIQLNVAHIQITDHLALGILKHLIGSGRLNPGFFSLETHRMASWNPVAESLSNGTIDAAFVLAPIAMDLFAHQVPIRLVLFAHKNGSIFVKNRLGGKNGSEAEFFRGKSFLIPHLLSVHHMLAHRFLKGLGLKPGVPGKGGDIDVTFEVVPPVKMPGWLKQNPDAAGFMVAEPIGTKSISAGIAELGFISGQAWPGHPCCVVVFRREIIEKAPEAVQEFVTMLVEAGRFISRETHLAAEAAIPFLDPTGDLGLTTPILKNVLSEAGGITTGDLYPVIDDLEQMQAYMAEEMGVGRRFDLRDFVDVSFADKAIGVGKAAPAPGAAQAQAKGAARAVGADSKAMLGMEGKYLTFNMANQEFGINIMRIIEIIGLMPVTELPQAPNFIKGVINLRGKIIPVIDLRLKMGLPEAETTDRTCIIVVEMNTSDGLVHTGLVVDSVSEVAAFKAGDLERPPSFGVGVETEFISAMAKQDSKVKILLDLDRVLGVRETAALSEF